MFSNLFFILPYLKSTVNKLRALILLCFIAQAAIAQHKEVAITIDDIPNVYVYKQHGFSSPLLNQIDELKLPVAIFINESNVHLNEFEKENRQGLVRWLTNKNITPGNHSYSHMNYSDTSLAAFKDDVVKGAIITKETIKKNPLYFRFPYNSMGKDSVAHQQVKAFLKEIGYINTPFTIESEDWAFNNSYEVALRNNDIEKAKQIGESYLTHTLQLFGYFEKLCKEVYGRNIKHIYLCHDNQLNTDYLGELIKRLKNNDYAFISLNEALKDKVYQSKDYYTGGFGFSWVYRWQPDEMKRKSLMKQEPPNEILK
jgi:peptidoglycan/xylan/chitin deacetylase (PgdA/CDA1 family)